jgi:serralysin
MPSPLTSSGTTIFVLSGVSTIDPLLNEICGKWSANAVSEVALTYSFPWINGATGYWQTNYSLDSEQDAPQHFGLNAAQMAAAAHALHVWADVAAITFSEVPDTEADVGDFRFAFSSAVVQGVWGYSSYPDNYWASAADVWINPSLATESDWASGSYNELSLVHEIGHGLGLKHPGNYDASGNGTPGPYLPADLDFRSNTVMSYNSRNQWFLYQGQNQYTSVNPSTPMVYDIAAIQYLYGANNSYHTGDDTWRFDPLTPFYFTIWDAGGNDTLDLSNFSTRCDIDLTPGHYSSIRYTNEGAGTDLYDGTHNLGIAFGAIIENATGGSNTDIITGNNVNNILAGGGGNDTLSGGAGYDTLDGGDGLDSAVFSGNYAEYQISYDSSTSKYFVVDKNANRDGMDSVHFIENFTFVDRTLAVTDGYDFTTAGVPPVRHNLTGSITFWKTGAVITDATSTIASVPDTTVTLLVEFRNIQVAADGSRTVELWENSVKGDITSLQLELTLPTGSVPAWQDATGLPAGWNSLANTGISGHFILGGMGTTALSAGTVKLGTLALTVPANPQHFDLSLSAGWLGIDPVPAVGTALDTMTTALDGLYQHLAMADDTYALTSAKVSGTAESNAVKANDALAALKIAVGMNPNADGSAVSPYQYLAADVNKDGQVKAADALNILKMAVKFSTAPEKEWLFVPESVGSESMSRTHVVWPDNPISVTLNVDQDLPMIGIVKGDVDGSWVA